jgi:hypothetical protein
MAKEGEGTAALSGKTTNVFGWLKVLSNRAIIIKLKVSAMRERPARYQTYSLLSIIFSLYPSGTEFPWHYLFRLRRE